MKKTNLILSILSIILLVPTTTQAATTDDDEPMANGVILKKSVSDEQADGGYTITLGAYTTGQRITKIEQTRQPADIILLLDDSGSMDDTYYTYSYVAQSSQSYDYSDFRNTSLYYKLNDAYYKVNRETASISIPYYYLTFTSLGQRYLSGTSSTGTEPTNVTDPNATIWTGVLYTSENNSSALPSQGYSYNSYGNNTYYYKNSVGVFDKVYRGTGTKDQTVYNLYITVNGMKYYLTNSGELTTVRPTDVTSNNATIWTGVLYKNQQVSNGSRLSNLKKAVNAFIDVVNQDAIANKVEHRISIIAFSSANYPSSGYTTSGNTNFLKESTTSGRTRVLKNFVDASSSANATSLKNAVNSMGGSGDTSSDYAMNLANLEFSAYGRTNVAQTVVMFTDGVPNHGGNPLDAGVANDAIIYAKTLKGNGAKVFTVGIVSNPTDDMLHYMHGVSSNYPNATGINSLGSGSDNFGYYKDASAGGLTDVFEAIASEAVEGGADINLNETSIVVVDVLSNYFQLPAGVNASSITTYTVPCNGYDEGNKEYLFDETAHEAVSVTISVNSQTKEVDVTGFNFAENFCGKDISVGSGGESDFVYTGKKLVIEIPIIVDPANPGGANLVTNDATKSGIYTGKMENGQLVKDEKVSTFPKPMVILPNIVLVKQGLQRKGESATFRIERVADKQGNAFDGVTKPFYISLTQTDDYTDGGEQTELIAKIKLLEEGWYRITETSWSNWYAPSVNTSKTLYRKGANYSNVNKVYVTDTDVSAGTANGCPYLIRYVGDDTEWETLKVVDGKNFYSVGTPFYFKNELKGTADGFDPSKYSESNIINKFYSK